MDSLGAAFCTKVMQKFIPSRGNCILTETCKKNNRWLRSKATVKAFTPEHSTRASRAPLFGPLFTIFIYQQTGKTAAIKPSLRRRPANNQIDCVLNLSDAFHPAAVDTSNTQAELGAPRPFHFLPIYSGRYNSLDLPLAAIYIP